jgi:hypothetical protein
MKNTILLSTLLLATLTGPARASSPYVSLDRLVLNLGSISSPAVNAWVPYPTLRNQRCALKLSVTDEVAIGQEKALFTKLQKAIVVTNIDTQEPGGLPLTLTPKGLTLDLRPFAGAFGASLAIRTSDGSPLSTTIHRILGKGANLELPIDLVVDTADCPASSH